MPIKKNTLKKIIECENGTPDEIAARSGVSRSTVYRLFSDLKEVISKGGLDIQLVKINGHGEEVVDLGALLSVPFDGLFARVNFVKDTDRFDSALKPESDNGRRGVY